MKQPSTIVAVFLWTIGLAWLFVAMTALMVMALFVNPDRTDRLTRIYLGGQLRLLFCRWTREVHPDIDDNQTYMFAQNHVNIFDYATMYNASPHFKQGLENVSHFKIPMYGWFMKQRGTIGVDRRRPDNKARIFEDMKDQLERGNSLLVFPEGSRTRDGRVSTFRAGTFELAIRLGVPIIPTAVTGMFEVLPTPGWKIRAGVPVTVHLCAPIPTEGLTLEDAPRLAKQVETAVAEKVDQYYASLPRGSA